MPTESIQAHLVTAPNTWLLGAGANKVVAVNSPDDDDTSYIRGYSGFPNEQYSLAANTIPPGSTVNSVNVYHRGKRETSSGKWRARLYISGVYADGLDRNPSSYTTYNETITRPGGGVWALADIASLEVAVQDRGTGGYSRVTTLFVIVDYTPPAAGTSAMLLMF